MLGDVGQLKLKTTLTVKPNEFHIQVRPREGVALDRGGPAPTTATAAAASTATAVRPVAPPVPPADRHGTPLRVLFGSNLGTAEGVATTLAGEGTERGYAVTLGPLDEHVDDLPTDGATLIVSASYNGYPPDNAVRFCAWLQDPATPDDACAGVSYAVFGCGDTEWAATYQKVPTLIDTQLEAHGATRIHARGEGNAAGDFDGQYRGWHGDVWADLATALDLPRTAVEPAGAGPRLSVAVVNRQQTNPVVMSYTPPRWWCRTTASWSGPPPTRRRSGRSATSRSRCRRV